MINKVLLAANASFYREHRYMIEEPTEEEIMAEFPEFRKEDTKDPAEAPADGKRGRKATK